MHLTNHILQFQKRWAQLATLMLVYSFEKNIAVFCKN